MKHRKEYQKIGRVIVFASDHMMTRYTIPAGVPFEIVDYKRVHRGNRRWFDSFAIALPDTKALRLTEDGVYSVPVYIQWFSTVFQGSAWNYI